MTPAEKQKFIVANYQKMTIKQMAAELNYADCMVSRCLRKLGLKALAGPEILKNLILANTDKTAQEIADMRGCSPNYVTSMAKEMGVVLKAIEKPAVQNEAKESIELTPEQQEKLGRMANMLGYGEIKKHERIKEHYTQTSSPFGFADTLRGIKTRS